jgi:peptide chain release factor 3
VFGSERDTIDEAYPGDVIGLVNATELRIGDTLAADDAPEYPPIPRFAPELFAIGRPRASSRYKQFRRGVAQLEEEGVVQALRDPAGEDATPVLAAVGAMQFDVLAYRLEHEFGAAAELIPTAHKVVRRTDEATAARLRGGTGVRILARADGVLLALFESPFWLQRLEMDHPDWCLEPIVTN